MRKVLVTGFEPFGGESINPALEAVKQLEGREIGGCRVVTRALPVVRHAAIEVLLEHLRETDPVLVIAVGQAGGRLEINPERVAINIDDFRIPDNGGLQPIDEAIVAGAPVAYWSTLPIKAMVEAMRRAGVPAAVSNTAGTFVCNHIMYQLHYLIEQQFPAVRGGFIHVPYITEQVADKVNQPCLAMSDITRALALAIEAVVLQQDGDLKVVGGEIS